MSIVIYKWRQAVKEWGEIWADLVDSGGFNPSLHPDWMGSYLSSHDLIDSTYVIKIESTGVNVAIVPVILRNTRILGMPLRCLDLVSNLLSYHAELLVSGDATQVIASVLDSEISENTDVFRLGNLVSSGLTVKAINELPVDLVAGVTSYRGESSPYFSLEQDWSKYISELPKKMRANIKGSIRSTQGAGENEMIWYREKCDVDRLLSDIFEVEKKSWKASDNKAIRSDSKEGMYYRNLLPWLSGRGLLANILYINGKPASYVLCANWNGWIGQLKTSFSEEVRDAGFRVIHASIENSFSEGNREYDFLGDVAPHKMRWANKIRTHNDVWIFNKHIKGRMLLSVKRLTDKLNQRSIR